MWANQKLVIILCGATVSRRIALETENNKFWSVTITSNIQLILFQLLCHTPQIQDLCQKIWSGRGFPREFMQEIREIPYNSGSIIVVTTLDCWPGGSWFELVPIFYETRHRAYPSLHPLGVVHWVPVLSNIKTATGCESNRQLQLWTVFAGPSGNYI